MLLTKDQMDHLDQLIEAVSSDPEFIRTSLKRAKFARDLPFAAAFVAASCYYLMAHNDDATVNLLEVAGRTYTVDEREILRRLDFIRTASLDDLLDVRRRAIESHGKRES